MFYIADFKNKIVYKLSSDLKRRELRLKFESKEEMIAFFLGQEEIQIRSRKFNLLKHLYSFGVEYQWTPREDFAKLKGILPQSIQGGVDSKRFLAKTINGMRCYCDNPEYIRKVEEKKLARESDGNS